MVRRRDRWNKRDGARGFERHLPASAVSAGLGDGGAQAETCVGDIRRVERDELSGELMADHNYLIPNEDRAILGILHRKTLENIEGYRYDIAPSEEKTSFYFMTRIHMEDGSA